MANTFTVIRNEQQGRSLKATALRMIGYSRICASGTFAQSYALPDGSTLEEWIEFGFPRWFHVPADYTEVESPFNRRGLRY